MSNTEHAVPLGEAPTPMPTPATATPPQRATMRFMRGHPARWLALGFGSGLSPWAPGTVGTLWAWLSFLVINPWLGTAGWAALLLGGLAVGVWACTRTAQHLGVADPGAIVWDEIIAFWAVLWVVTPAGWGTQVAAFVVFRYFDAAKPGPVAWADQRYKLQRGQAIAWWQGWGIMFDDLVAAGCTLLVLALWVHVWR
jgi:phosphatidylglycerophosphatase A